MPQERELVSLEEISLKYPIPSIDSQGPSPVAAVLDLSQVLCHYWKAPHKIDMRPAQVDFDSHMKVLPLSHCSNYHSFADFSPSYMTAVGFELV